MRLSIRELLLLPALVVACVPIVTAAELLGLILLPQFTANGSEIRSWLLARGFTEDFVCRHVTFFAMQVPTILILAGIASSMFAFRIRIFDIFALTLFATFPLIDSFHVGWGYFRNQSFALAAVSMLVFVCIYILARIRFPAERPTRVRATLAISFATMILLPCALVWKNWG